MIIRSAMACGLTLASCSLGAQEWPPVPKEIWGFREDPTKGITGAWVDVRLVFTEKSFERILRFRILSGEGRRKIQPFYFDPETTTLFGRTVYPDGRQILHDPKKDLKPHTVAVGDTKRTEMIPVPPGLSDDCVVEFHYKERLSPESQGLPPRYGGSRDWRLGNNLFTRNMTIEIQKDLKIGHHVVDSTSIRAERREAQGMLSFHFKDIPALMSVPFALDAQTDVPRLFMWRPIQGTVVAEGAEAKVSWGLLGARLRSYYETGVRAGKAFDSFAEGALRGAPEAPQARALHLLVALEKGIVNLNAMTFEEKLRRDQVREDLVHPKDLDESVAKGRTTGNGMAYLYYHLLKRGGIKPQLMLVSDRNVRLFDPSRPDIYQFDGALLGVPNETKAIFWITPQTRYFPPGLLEPRFQGTRGLNLDMATGRIEVASIPVQAAGMNRAIFHYAVEAGQEGDAFSIQAGFTGVPEFQERTTYLGLEAKEQERLLKERLGEFGRRQNIQIQEAHVANVAMPDLNLSWKVKGRMEPEEGRHRKVIPFPALPSLLSVPQDWPENRSQPIVLPYCAIKGAISRIKIPGEFSVHPEDPFERSNDFGKVTWTLKPVEGSAGREWEVVHTVVLSKAIQDAEQYQALRTFMAWVEEAESRRVLLERKP